jgi:Tfp pilus assembly protein PilF
MFFSFVICLQEGEAAVLNNLGTLCYSNGEFDRCLSYYQQALKIYKDVSKIGSIKNCVFVF